jgi:hypothetical protein
VPFSTRATTARHVEVEESFEDSKRTNLRRESVFYAQGPTSITEVESRPFGWFEFEEVQKGKAS